MYFAAVSLVLSAVERVVDDMFTKVPSQNARAVLKVGTTMTKLLNSSHEQQADTFCSTLVSSIRGCIPVNMKSTAASRESFWQRYHQLRCSQIYCSNWQDFLKELDVDVDASPLSLFYQCVGDRLLEELVKLASPIDEQDSNEVKNLNEMEMNALRYAAGYVPRSLFKKLMKSADPLKRELQLCLWDLLDDEKEGGTADDWVDAIDRGGLTRVNEMTFQVFLAMELELRKHLSVKRCVDREQTCKFVVDDEEVLFYWSIVGGDWEQEESEQLLKLVANLYITMRGFSYASAWVENFKSSTKTTLQKSKALRKKLNSN